VTLEAHPQTGNLLVASPTLLDRNFSRTVVLLCAHDQEGSMGLVLNRPMSMTFADILVGVSPEASEKVLWGGPVEPERLLLLQRGGLEGPLPEIAEGVHFAREEDFMHDLMHAPKEHGREYRMFAGYAGWGEGQLQQEMDQCSWLITSAPAHAFVFDTSPDGMWAAAIRSLGPEYAHLVTMPLDPRVN